MSRNLAALLICGAAALLPGRAGFARVSLTGDFDHGALGSWSGNALSLSLVGRDNYYGGGRWRWLYFKASGVNNAAPTFSISSNFAGDSTPGLHELQEHEMVYSYDNEHWSFFDNNQLSGPSFTFSNAAPFAQDEVYIAYAIPYSYGRSAAHTQQVLASPWATPTLSGDQHGVIGGSTPGVDDLGRATPALDLFGYRITNPATDSPTQAKRKIVISSGLHAGEPLGTHVYEGMVNWLLSDDPRAGWVRDNVEVFGYPVLNPSGRYMGTNRTTVNNINRDPNGLWDPTRWSSGSFGCGGSNCQEIRAAGQAMMADVAATPGGVDTFIDFHSTVPDYQIDEENGVPEDFAFINSDDFGADWWGAFRALRPNVLQEASGGGNYTTAGFARRRLGAEVEVTFETQFTWERNTDYYRALGESFGLSFFNAWAPRLDGDFNFDGLVDAADYTVWRDSRGQSGAGLAADANGDFVIDAMDYAVWRGQYGQSHSVGALAAPAPTALAGLVTIGLMLAIACRHSLRPSQHRLLGPL